MTYLKTYPVPLPTADEQREIAGVFRGLIVKAAVHRRRRALLGELFRALLHQLMTGRIRVHDLGLPELDTAAGLDLRRYSPAALNTAS